MAQRALRSVTNTPRASRHAKPTASYTEPSSDVDDEYQDSDTLDNAPLARKRRKREQTSTKTSIPLVKRQRTSSSRALRTKSLQTKSPAKRQNTKQIIKKAVRGTVADAIDHDQYSAGFVPSWTSLPYHILVQIFQCASYPLCDERTFQSLPSVDWLVKVSRTCRSFAEPALTNLYRSPALVPMERAHRLCRLLSVDQSSMSYNYRAKVERLEMDVAQTAAYTLTGFGLLDLHSLIYYSPRLIDLELYHQNDMAPYRNLADSITWSYPEELISALSENVEGVPTKLRSWRWSSRLAKKWPLWKVSILHQTPSFNGLRKLAFVNYQVPVLKKHEEDPMLEIQLAKAISLLPHLEHLIFESSELLNIKLLPLLPTQLRHLEFINCWEVTADIMAKFLLSHGHQLRTITLNHNQSLNLSFLPILKQACPHLTALKMNLTYYDNFSSYRDASKLDYDHLILKDEQPAWPSTLQTIELQQLRNWDLETADMFFQTLVDAATELPDLRRLVIKAIINASWRDRVAFRDKWTETFERIFKRQSPEPNFHLRSFGAYAVYKRANGTAKFKRNEEQQEDDNDANRMTRRSKNATAVQREVTVVDTESREMRAMRSTTLVPRRSLNRFENNLQDENEDDEEFESLLNQTQQSPRPSESRALNRELRILAKTAGKSRSTDFATSRIQATSAKNVSDDKPLSMKGKGRRKKAEYIQGMCDVVDIRIDNLRPTETQFGEADFLDSEPEGDEDWDGGEDDAGGGDYAW